MIRPIRRNEVSVVLAILSALIVISAPITAIAAVWAGDFRWLWTGVALLVLAAALYTVATVLFDAEEGEK